MAFADQYHVVDVREVKKSKYLQTIDSLIQVYQDIPEAGELAVEHFRFMEGATDAKPLDKLNYINYAHAAGGGCNERSREAAWLGRRMVLACLRFLRQQD